MHDAYVDCAVQWIVHHIPFRRKLVFCKSNFHVTTHIVHARQQGGGGRLSKTSCCSSFRPPLYVALTYKHGKSSSDMGCHIPGLHRNKGTTANFIQFKWRHKGFQYLWHPGNRAVIRETKMNLQKHDKWYKGETASA